MQEQEIWKDIPDYEGHYQVSNFGRVKSFKWNKEKYLSISKDTKGYLQTGLKKGIVRKSFKVHKLVAMAFLGHKPDGTNKIVVDHIDNNQLNNRLDNLQLITNRENASKDRKNGTSKYTGVFFDKRRNRYSARIEFYKNYVNLGSYKNEIDAHNAYQKALSELNQGLDLNVLYPKKVKTNKYIGVCYINCRKGWLSKLNKKVIGLFPTEQEAFEAIESYKKLFSK